VGRGVRVGRANAETDIPGTSRPWSTSITSTKKYRIFFMATLVVIQLSVRGEMFAHPTVVNRWLHPSKLQNRFQA
jgi:hypothetical protein